MEIISESAKQSIARIEDLVEEMEKNSCKLMELIHKADGNGGKLYINGNGNNGNGKLKK